MKQLRPMESEGRYPYFRCSNEEDGYYTLVKAVEGIEEWLGKRFTEVTLRTETLPAFRLYEVKES